MLCTGIECNVYMEERREAYEAPRFEYLGDPDQELLCPICFDPFTEPATHLCGNTFCGKCLARCDNCPICRNVVIPNGCVTALLVRNQTDRLRVVCITCRRVMERGGFAHHARGECEVLCPSGCGKRITRRDAESHDAECPEKPVVCITSGGCSWHGPRKELPQHLSGECRLLKKVEPIHKTFGCSLEELYTGCIKRMKVKRNVTYWDGKATTTEKILEIHVKRGWKPGTKVTFSGEGDIRPGP